MSAGDNKTQQNIGVGAMAQYNGYPAGRSHARVAVANRSLEARWRLLAAALLPAAATLFAAALVLQRLMAA